MGKRAFAPWDGKTAVEIVLRGGAILVRLRDNSAFIPLRVKRPRRCSFVKGARKDGQQASWHSWW